MVGSDTVALVTGANRGIGFAIARGLAEHGLLIALAGRNRAQARQAAQSLLDNGFRASSVVVDVSRSTTVNNAGITGGDQRPSTADPDLVRDVLNVNVLGAWRCYSAVIPTM